VVCSGVCPRQCKSERDSGWLDPWSESGVARLRLFFAIPAESRYTFTLIRR
jgi:hypothetical protein